MSLKFLILSNLFCFIVFFFVVQGVGHASEKDKAKWNNNFAGGDYKYGKDPAPYLKENIVLLRKGRALDIAAGEGRNSVFLALNGFEVDALDISEVGLAKTRFLAREKGVGNLLNTIQADMDSYVLPVNRYDTIVMVNFTDKKSTGMIVKALKQGGTFFYQARTMDYVRKQGKKFNPGYLWETNEVLKHFGEYLNVIKYEENPNDTKSQVYFIGVKP